MGRDLFREEVERLRQLGLIEHTEAGAEAVRVTAQFHISDRKRSRTLLREALLDRQKAVQPILQECEAAIVPDSLSVSGQLVEMVVPVSRLEDLSAAMSGEGVRIDLISPRRGTL